MILNFDESGNLGRQGRFFTIACVLSDHMKPLNNVMKKAVLKTRGSFSEYADKKEIKASDSSPIIKEYMCRKIASKEIEIRYIVADLEHVNEPLKKEENLLYNYMLHFLIVPVAQKNGVKNLTLNLDKRTIKVKSTNSFEDYIKTKINFEMGLDIKIEVNYIESQNSYSIQAADFVANAVNSFYEYGHDYNYRILDSKFVQKEQFPRALFGAKRVVNI
jgi:hypothetical protein